MFIRVYLWFLGCGCWGLCIGLVSFVGKGEHFGDDFFERGIFDADVLDGVVGQDRGEDLGDAATVDTESGFGFGDFEHLAIASQIAGHATVGELQGKDFMAAEAVDDAGQRAVVHDVAVGDDDDAFAKGDDIFHVMAREQDGDLALLLIVLEEFLDVVLRNDVETDGGLVEKEHLG